MDQRRAVRAALPVVPAVVLFVALLAALPNDPAGGVSLSSSPFTDEGFDLLNARNLVVFGDWSTGDWNLHLVNGPFSAAAAGLFQLFGVGLIPARLLSTTLSAVSVAIVGLAVATRFGPRFGHLAGAIAAVALGSSALMLYYGRLAFLEPMVTLFLVSGTTVMTTRPRLGSARLGLAGGALLGLAIATKVSAAFAVIGILAGISVAGSLHDGRTRRRLVAAVGGIGVVAIGWLVVIGLPNWSAVMADLRIWAQPGGPADPADLLVRLAKYPRESDRALPYTFTLLLAAVAGAVMVRRRWHTLDRGFRLIVGACVGWFVVGMAVLMAVDYRPNRYVVPLLPPLAILAGAVAWEIGWRLRSDDRLRAIGVTVLAIGLALPGASAYASWVASARSDTHAIQAQVARLVPASEGIEGELAPLFGMTTRSPIFVSRPSDAIDAGNLYAQRNVHWVLVRRGSLPRWWYEAPEAVAQARPAFCFEWGGNDQCLVHIP